MTDETQGSPPAPAHDTEAAIKFLRNRVEVDGVRPLVLSASRVDVNTGEKAEFFSRNFGPKPNWTEVAAWIEQGQGSCNLYYSDCVLTDSYVAHNKARGYTDAKGEPGHVQAVVMLHADIDPNKGESARECVERSLTSLQRLKLPKPSHAVMSGGGVQFFWLLEQPLPIECKDERALKAKRYNVPLAAELGGDTSGCNVDHIYRIPGTVNIPVAAKRAKGRTELTLARVLWDEGHKHALDRFKLAPDPDAAVPKAEGKAAKVAGPVTAKSRVGQPIPSAPPVADFNDPRVGMLSDDTKRIMEHGEDPERPKQDGKDVSRSAWVYDFCCRALRDSIAEDTLFAILVDNRWKISASVLDKKKPARDARRAIDNARKGVVRDENSIVVSKHDHLGRTRIFIENDAPSIRYYKNEFYEYHEGAYRIIEDEAIRGRIWMFLETCLVKSESDKGPPFVRCCPNSAMIGESFNCLKAITALDSRTVMPSWLDDRDGPTKDLVSFPNGILNLSTGEFIEPTPMLFTQTVLGFDFEPTPPPPVNFLAFLRGIFTDVSKGTVAEDEIELLREVLGYIIGPDVNLEKFFGLYGPPRSGKDTLQKIIVAMLGQGLTCGPTLESLGEKFGMEVMLGMQVAIIGDMRLSGTKDAQVVEHILKLTGRGFWSFERKYGKKWSGYLHSKLLILSNERLKLRESSGALAKRHIVVTTRQSFEGHPDYDPNLFDMKIMPEIASIFVWVWDGLKRLRANQGFTETVYSRAQRDQIERDGSPELSFIDDCLEIADGESVNRRELYDVYLDYLHEIGKKYQPDLSTFLHKLSSALMSKGAHVVTIRPKAGNPSRERFMKGIKIVSRPESRPSFNRKRGPADDTPGGEPPF